jgi:FkbM family methyltransferase
MNQEAQLPDAGQSASDTERSQRHGLIGQTPTRRGMMTFFRNDRGALTQALQAYGEWAEHEIAFCSHFLRSGDTVLDVGAYIGTHALAFAERVGPGGHVYSFEAQPASFALLVRNLAAVAHVTTVHAAVTDPLAGGSIPLDAIDVAEPRSYGSAAIGDASAKLHPIRIPATTLDALDLPSCALVKIDVEGMENQVLLGAERLLSACAPLIYAECNTVDAGSRVISRLRMCGYDVWMHLADAYNPCNWRGNATNIFGNAKEAALVGVPIRHRITCASLPCGKQERFFEIRTLDDLVAGMLLKPQYPREVLQGSSAFRQGGGHG